ncbi:ARP2/3 actin-organizing complex subunit Arc5 [Turnera subulata]|uniref:ARP2/3 actin-organizing complex subunit Arc5 n=1 Tax=Turnera subulata TaxID=218843 RepID=A0A9Q0FSQ2_9ROSI|nr:ARP2/3 actin-organizing complex subunit Arc5 [Turnera subulata]
MSLAISLREMKDIELLTEKLGRPLSERNRIRVSKLRSFLEELLQKRWISSIDHSSSRKGASQRNKEAE